MLKRGVLSFAVLCAAGVAIWYVAFRQESSVANTLMEYPSYRQDYVEPLGAQDVPPGFVEAWFTIMGGAVPPADDLAQFEGLLDTRFGVEPRDGRYKRQHSMLSIALAYNNLDAVIALLEAGADPNTAGRGFAIAARSTTYPEQGGGKDWDTSILFLEQYIQHGGNPDYALPTDDFPMLYWTSANGNFVGFHYLLAQGADPWIRIKGFPASPPTGRNAYAFPSTLGGTVRTTRHILKFFRDGWMKDAPEPMVQMVYDNLTEGYDRIAAGQTMLEAEEIGLLTEVLEVSLTLPHSYARDTREAAVAALSDYLERQGARK